MSLIQEIHYFVTTKENPAVFLKFLIACILGTTLFAASIPEGILTTYPWLNQFVTVMGDMFPAINNWARNSDTPDRVKVVYATWWAIWPLVFFIAYKRDWFGKSEMTFRDPRYIGAAYVLSNGIMLIFVGASVHTLGFENMTVEQINNLWNQMRSYYSPAYGPPLGIGFFIGLRVAASFYALCFFIVTTKRYVIAK